MHAFLSTLPQFIVARDETYLYGQEDNGNWFTNHVTLIVLIVVALILLSLLIAAIEIVSEKTARVVERLGKFHRILMPGLRIRIPFIDQVVERMGLQIMELSAQVKVKTNDNVFVTLPVSVQYRVQDDKIKEAYYELENPEEIITSLVLNEVKATSAGMTLEEMFSNRDQLENGVKVTLEEKIGGYGYLIVNVVVDNPTLSAELETSFNNVQAAQRDQEAATAQAEALRIKLVGEATANAEGMKISADAVVSYRHTVAAGHAADVKTMTEGTNLDHSEVLRFMSVTDSNDAIRDAAGKGATVVVATPTSSDGLYATLAPQKN